MSLFFIHIKCHKLISLFICSKELKFFNGHSDAVTDVCFAGNDVLCSASVDKTLCLWDVNNGHRFVILIYMVLQYTYQIVPIVQVFISIVLQKIHFSLHHLNP